MSEPLRVKLLTLDSKAPVRMTALAAGYDLFSAEKVDLPPQSRVLVDTGIAVAIEPGFEGQVRPRSGLATKNGVTVLNAPGTIDADYRGPVKVLMYNTTTETFSVAVGDRIAQLVLSAVHTPEVAVVDDLPATERGAGGFGSTGA